MNAPSTPNFLFILLLCNNLPRLFSLFIPFQCNSNSANSNFHIINLAVLADLNRKCKKFKVENDFATA